MRPRKSLKKGLGFLNQTSRAVCWRDMYKLTWNILRDDVGFRVAIGALTSLALIHKDVSGPTLHVHPLVHEWIRGRLNSSPRQQAKFTIAATLI